MKNLCSSVARFFGSYGDNVDYVCIESLMSHSTQYRSFRRRGKGWAVMYTSNSVMEGHNNSLNPRCFCLQRPRRDGYSS